MPSLVISNPQALDGIRMHQVAAGVGLSVYLAPAGVDNVEKLPVFESLAPAAEATAADEEEGGGKSKGAAAGAKRKAEPAAVKGSKKAATKK